MEFLLQPYVYSTGQSQTLLSLLEKMWMKSQDNDKGTLYIVTGFANYNGGVRFYPFFSRYIQDGGRVVAIVSGSTSQRLSSRQVVEALLGCGANVCVINRKRLMHAKCYGFETDDKEELIVSSGNFTGPGMSQNGEAAIWIDSDDIRNMDFSWSDFTESIYSQNWMTYHLTKDDLDDNSNPVWSLLYDEIDDSIKLDESQCVTMLVTLGHSDTARIQAEIGSNAGKGTQYFWLSKTAFDFFPALTIPNTRGYKPTYSCSINIEYIDLNLRHTERVTYEAGNNLDFRLGTSRLRYTKLADEGDLAAITRLAEYEYQLRIIRAGTPEFSVLSPYATTYTGNMGKRFGYIQNDDFMRILNLTRLTI